MDHMGDLTSFIRITWEILPRSYGSHGRSYLAHMDHMGDLTSLHTEYPGNGDERKQSMNVALIIRFVQKTYKT